ncbi:hypothetical protein HK100_002775 [Physocladia obscura]|uniref:Flavin-containing monooxygenase n=1 Tax=Physocladia obscura TaxID=109957 RepID=A0AAD5SUY6_9FUNG|nr:hypothetical protein HK100_002775 [Physocladia obscura]
MTSLPQQKVGIIGAGLAGLVAARHFLHAGWIVTLFESQAAVGGIWRSSYPFAKLQSPSSVYHLGEFPFPESVDKFATKTQLEDYFSDYADYFGITERIRFNSKVLKIQKRPDGKKGWRLTVEHSNQQYAEDFDFVVSAQGLYSGAPRIPEMKGRETFQGTIVHSSELKEVSMLLKPTTIVLGGNKTALEFLTKRIQDAHPSQQSLLKSYWVFRRAKWLIPQNIFGIIPFRWRVSNRLVTHSWAQWLSLIRAHNQLPDPPKTKVELAAIEKSRYQEIVEREKPVSRLFISAFGYKPADVFLPSFRLSKQCGMDAQTPGFFNLVRSGAIEAIANATIESFNGNTVHLSNRQAIDNVDVVVLATGFSQTMLLPEGVPNSLIENGGIFLYRNVIHPEIEDFAFLGFTACLQITSATSMAAHWLMGVLRGHVKLPSRTAQLKDIQRRRQEVKERCGQQEFGAGQVNHTAYLDQICRDLRISPLRKIRNWVKWGGIWNPLAWVNEILGKYGPADYKFLDIESELDEAVQNIGVEMMVSRIEKLEE